MNHVKDAEDLVLALGRAANLTAALRVLGNAVEAQPRLLDDHRAREVVDGVIDTALTECWSTDEVQVAIGERAARRLTW